MKKAVLITLINLLIPQIIAAQGSLLDKIVEIDKTSGTVKSVLTEISTSGGFFFTYGQEVPVNKRIMLSSSTNSVGDFLSEIIGPGYYFVEFGNKILLKKKPVEEEKVIVRGRVIDRESKEALPGVSVFIPGTMKGVISDTEGYFQIDVPSGLSFIRFSSVGYEQRNLQPGEFADKVIELDPEKQEIDEVVIVGASIPVERSINIARAGISGEELYTIQLYSIDEVLLGSVSGVHAVPQTGMPGANIVVKIRGNHSLINSEPSYSLNGIPVQRAVLGAIAPKSIGSVEVIKDPSGTALYGASGGNGVVLLNSRKEKEDGFHAAFEYYTGFQKLWRQYDMLSGDEFLEFRKLAYPTLALPPGLDTTSRVDWQKELFHPGRMQEYHLSLSGKNENHSIAVDLENFRHSGIIGSLNFERYTLGLSADHRTGKRLKIDESIHLADIECLGIREGNFMSDYSNTILSSFLVPPFSDTSGIPIATGTLLPHPLDDIELAGNVRKNFVLLGSLGIELDLGDRLTYSARTGLELFHQDILSYTNSPPILISGPAFELYRNEYTIEDFSYTIRQLLEYRFTMPEGQTLDARAGFEYGSTSSAWLPYRQLMYPGRDAFYSGSQGDSMLYYSNLSYTTEFHNQAVFAALDYTLNSRYFINLVLRRDAVSFPFDSRMQKPSAVYPSLVFGWMFSENDRFSERQNLSFGKLRAGIGKAGISPKLNYSYYAQMTRELEYLVALNANENIYGINNSALLRQSTEQFYWEDLSSANLGLDLGFFRNKLFLTMDYFIARLNMGEQYPADNPLAFISELSQRRYYRINYPPNSRILNQGIELEISYKERFSELSSNFSFRIAHLRNRILEIADLPLTFLYDEEFDLISANIPGYPAGSFYGYRIERLFTEADTDESGRIVNQPYTYDARNVRRYAQSNARPGDYKFTDLNNDSILDQKDKSILGNPMPDLIFGFDWHIDYKAFDLSLMVQGSYGNEILNITRLFLLNPYGGSNWPREILDSYRSPVYENGIMTDPGNTNTDLHRMVRLDSNHNLRLSDLFIEDGSYLRIKNLQIGYTLQPAWTSKIHVERFRIYLSARNLYTLTRYPGMDPEVGGWGVDCGNYPQPRSFLAGVNLEF